jgi:subtilisin family serine protease
VVKLWHWRWYVFYSKTIIFRIIFLDAWLKNCLDIHAPGVDIESTWNDGSTNKMSGTSMATPHIAGLAAYFLGSGQITTKGLCEYIKAGAFKDILSEVPEGTPNLLASNGASG